MKYILAVSLISCTVMFSFAQRPSYAGSRPIGKPELASRFRDPDADAQASEAPTLANRLGDGTTSRLPVDARGDDVLVDRLNQWPRENRPFWLLNFEHIEDQRNKQPTAAPAARPGVQSRFSEGAQETIPARPELPLPSFLGNRNRN